MRADHSYKGGFDPVSARAAGKNCAFIKSAGLRKGDFAPCRRLESAGQSLCRRTQGIILGKWLLSRCRCVL
ncbi:MAG: hypothetical protein DU429_08805 [Candidatus Tokpelaia sp.]|nr:MAG: hypothetical protein DU429_08805 [Candidatus Tokpelaia sp.]